MENKILCKCGKEAVSFITGEGWLCLECFNKKVERARIIFAKDSSPKISM